MNVPRAERRWRRKTRQMLDGLEPQQKLFVEVLLADKKFNIAGAAREAGYSGPRQATALMNNPKVQQCIRSALKLRSAKYQIDANRVLQELGWIGLFDARLLFDEHGNLIEPKDWSLQVGHAVASFDVEEETEYDEETGLQVKKTKLVKIRLCNKVPALELIARHLGMLNDKLEVKGEVGVTFINGLLKAAEASNTVDGEVISHEASMNTTLPATNGHSSSSHPDNHVGGMGLISHKTNGVSKKAKKPKKGKTDEAKNKPSDERHLTDPGSEP